MSDGLVQILVRHRRLLSAARTRDLESDLADRPAHRHQSRLTRRTRRDVVAARLHRACDGPLPLVSPQLQNRCGRLPAKPIPADARLVHDTEA
jgi:hypothetical protein